MLFRGRRLHVFAGRDICRLLPASIFIGLFPEKISRFPNTMYRFWWYFEAVWTWFPILRRVCYQPLEWTSPEEIHSARWTGREHVIEGWHWPFIFRCGFG